MDESSETKCEQGTKAYSYLMIENQWLNLFNQRDKKEIGIRGIVGAGGGGGGRRTNTPSTYGKGQTRIFRCSGLYGNQFSALHTIRKSGWKKKDKEVLAKGETNDEISITSRVHLDDVGRAILAYMLQVDDDKEHTINEVHNDDDDDDSQPVNRIFNLSDNVPASRDDVMQFAYALLKQHNLDIGKNQHQQKGGKGNERRRRRRKDRKRVSNRKMRALLKPYGGLMFPSFNSGLPDVLKRNTEEWCDDDDAK